MIIFVLSNVKEFGVMKEISVYVQYIFIAVAIIVATVYIGKMVRDTFFAKKDGCGTNCKCNK